MQTIEEVRRARLAILESEAGSQTKLADLLGKSPAQLSQWKNASTSSTGRERAMSSDAARSIEEKMGKPRGWMDTPLTYAEMHPNDRIAHAMMVMEGMTVGMVIFHRICQPFAPSIRAASSISSDTDCRPAI